MKMKYTEQAVETLDDAGGVIANKNIEIEQLRQRVAELEARLEMINPLLDEAADKIDALEKKRDELLAAAEAIEIAAEECLDFDECTAMLVPIDAYHKLMEAIPS